MVANHKLHQLAEARAAGLVVPRTLVSTDAAALRDFWHENSGLVVSKAVHSISTRFIRESVVTRQVGEDDIDVLTRSPRTATLFQELVPAEIDVRVTLVGDLAFSCAIHSQEGGSRLDWRLDQTVRMTAHNLEAGLLGKLQRLRSRLGLAYGAVDLRIRPDGTPVFLEINPRGIFSFVEYYTGAPIARSLAMFLAGAGGESSPPSGESLVDRPRGETANGLAGRL
ncbi:hypothetical protein BL253_27745 [Pseudofrankia asymbiotica]|uniref:ATP-grasp domain-containing protein n=2 Tax=Pseudofrankia asymbiotica TaxID=1834516 RepID=A0A1V2I4L4_9ACTN|nr:hypothetical protein BL253_27745 [Pseudofrankia asymbiotica]